jgi:hypothetical protein
MKKVVFSFLVSFALTLLLLVSFCSSAKGQTIVRFQVMSPGHEGVVPSVGKIRYYLLDEYLQLAAFDSELFKLRSDSENYKEIELELKKQLAAKDSVASTLKSDLEVFKARADRVDLNLKKCEVALAKASKPPVWPYALAAGGSLLGVVGATLLFYTIVTK